LEKVEHSKVGEVLAKEKRWPAEFSALRALCIETGLQESLKWGKACYDLDGANVVLIHGFKAYAALLFMKGALLKDAARILVRQTPTVQGPRQLRFTSVEEIRTRQAVIRRYLKEAIALERSGAEVQRKTLAEYEVPAELRERFRKEPALAKAFRALTPGRQKGYLLHFAGAKQSATRASRIERHAQRILQGKGLDD
jgi:uncharacterized protein YdeI (YjbR/CyaY-like superfamily)